MATTAGGSTYVVSTDLVADYPTSSLALANRVDVVASGGPVLVKTAGYTITVADILSGNKFLYNSASGGTFTFPTASLVDGMVIQVAQIGAGALTVSGGTIVGTTATTAQYQSLMFVYVASGTSWYSVAPPSTTPGLAIVTPTSIANSGGTATLSGDAVTYTTVNSVSLNGIFTAVYDNYKIMLEITDPSASSYIGLRVRAAGTDASTNYFHEFIGLEAGGGGFSSIGGNPAVSFQLFQTYSATSAWSYSSAVDVHQPFLARRTTVGGTAVGVSNSSGVPVGFAGGGFHNLSTSYDGFSIMAGSGTFTGVVRVYGYKNS